MKDDVVVIGAGPAGLSAAIALARRGVRVLVCEQATQPEDKPCGEGLLPSALEELTSLGLDSSDLSAAGLPLRGVRYFTPSGAQAEARFPEGAGLGLRRRELQRLLRQLAHSTPGLSYRRVAARVRCEGAGCHVRLSDEVASPRVVVAADGLASRTRRDASLRWETPAPLRYGARQHYAITPWSDFVEVHFHPTCEAYVTPVSADEINVAVLWQHRGEQPRLGSASLVPTFLRRFPVLAARLSAARALGKPQGRGPLQVRVPSPVRDGLVLIGDAAGYLDAITGEGVGLSVAKSRLLASHLAPLLLKLRGPIPARAMKPYLNAARELERPHRQLTWALLWLRRAPWLLERVVAALARDRQLFEHLLSANQGRAIPLALPAGSAWALCGQLLSRRSATESAG